jgi:hypothetical protein
VVEETAGVGIKGQNTGKFWDRLLLKFTTYQAVKQQFVGPGSEPGAIIGASMQEPGTIENQ